MPDRAYDVYIIIRVMHEQSHPQEDSQTEHMMTDVYIIICVMHEQSHPQEDSQTEHMMCI